MGQESGIAHLHIPTVDFLYAPPTCDLHKGVDFIHGTPTFFYTGVPFHLLQIQAEWIFTSAGVGSWACGGPL